ncbi:hypothetical protein KM043_001844 [Ampulex compressa]|nr:hypothetical protein KM043_001844 [Ampulex compressa]
MKNAPVKLPKCFHGEPPQPFTLAIRLIAFTLFTINRNLLWLLAKEDRWRVRGVARFLSRKRELAGLAVGSNDAGPKNSHRLLSVKRAEQSWRAIARLADRAQPLEALSGEIWCATVRRKNP